MIGLERATAELQGRPQVCRGGGVELDEHLPLDLVHGPVTTLEGAGSRFRQLDSDHPAVPRVRPPADVALLDDLAENHVNFMRGVERE